jgi:predicted transposase/invertase (TIGR01784 family)
MLTTEYDREMDIAVNRREAREEGLKEGKLIIAKNLLSEGSTPEFVQRITGLTLDEIEGIGL